MGKLAIAALSILAFTPFTISSSASYEPSEVAARRKLRIDTTVGGAFHLAPEEATASPSTEPVEIAVARRMTMTVINRHGRDVTTVHVRAKSRSSSVSGSTAPGE